MAKKTTKLQTQPTLIVQEEKPLVCPTQIGPYKVDSYFNQGGMSILYLGTHPETSNPIIIKILSPHFIQNKEIVERFLKEAQIIAMTDHPNIIKLYGQGTWEKGLYIAMEFINGVSLRQFILKKSLSQKRALEIILQVAYALCHLHTHGVIHRDLKPENIMITESGEVKVIDFGIAQLQGELHLKEEKKKKIIGTPIYMSPEQKINPLNVSYNSDIFSLGVITYELILGHLSHGIIHLDLLPKDLAPIVEKALKVDPKERYQDIVDFITDISEYIKTHFEEKILMEDPASHILLSFEKTKSFLFQIQPPDWSQMDIGIAISEGISLTGLYSEFFKLADGSFLIIIAEPIEEGVTSLVYTSNLKGIIKTLILQFGGKKELNPVTFLQQLNQIIINDLKEQKFASSLLLLNEEKEQLSFISCGHAPLFYIPQGNKKVTLLNTPNLYLGSDLGVTLVSTAANWFVGDRLLLTTKALLELEKEATPHLAKSLTNTLLFPPKQQVKKIFNEMLKNFNPTFSQRGVGLISIQRIF